MSANKHYRQKAVRRIVMLGMIVLGLILAGGVSLFAYLTLKADQAELAQERQFVSRHIDRLSSQLTREVETFGAWDEAYKALAGRPDLAWADLNVGHYFLHNLKQDMAVVLDSNNKPIKYWTASNAELTDAKLGWRIADVQPLVTQIRAQEAVNNSVPFLAEQFGIDAVLSRSGFVTSGGQTYMVAAATVVPETDKVARRAGKAPITLVFKKLKSETVADLAGESGIHALHLVVAKGRAEPAEVPLVDINGYVARSVAWTPIRPGLMAFKAAAPAIILGLIILSLAAVTLALRIHGIFRDLAAGEDALERTLEALVRAKDQADSANIAKSQFLANMSHEIRTPLNGILGMAQVMARRELTPDQAERLTIIRDSGLSLMTVLNDVLDFSKIEAGRLDIDNHEFDLVDAMEVACSTFSPLASQKGIALKLEVERDARGIWLGDGARIRQVIANLVSNAVKFTKAGEIVVRVEASGLGLKFSVRDTGMGIPKERISDLFQKFSQVDASTTRRFGGTGLGLAISRELVTLMGGRMTLESELGLGSTFTVELPLQLCSKSPADHLEAPALDLGLNSSPIRILAAEDNEANQLILSALFEPMNVVLTLVGNGLEAVEALQGEIFDVVLMDIQMPEMNGVEATSKIRAWEAKVGRSPTPILALSANVMSHHTLEYTKVGMNGTVAKPIEVGKMLAAISAVIEGGESTDRQSAAA